MPKVIIASKNPVKIEAVKNAFEKCFPNQQFEFEGISAESNVSNQPMSSTECHDGAINRAKNAQKNNPMADYWVGLEGGVGDVSDGMVSFSWVAVSTKGLIGKAKGGEYYLPEKVAELIREGKELGEADDIVYQRSNSKQAEGSIGILTNHLITRKEAFIHITILALIPFMNPELY